MKKLLACGLVALLPLVYPLKTRADDSFISPETRGQLIADVNKIGIYLTRNLTPVKSQDGHVETYILERSNYVLSLSVRDGNRFENIKYDGVFPGREDMLISFSDKGKVGLEGGDGYRSYIEGMTFNVFNTINTNYARIVNVEYAGVIRGIAEGITQKPPIKVEK